MRIGILLCAWLLGACQAGIAPSPEGFQGERALKLIEEQLAFGPRYPGASGHRQAGDWIAESLRQSGWEVELQAFVVNDIELRNIVARRAQGSATPIILGAHYDTRRYADQDPSAPHAPVAGANDGASGTAVLLELAGVLPARQLNCELWLVFFDAEDGGGIDGQPWIIGSRHFVDRLTVNPRAVVIVDMVADADLQLYYERNSTMTLQEEIWGVAAELGHRAFIPELKFAMLDDHTPFLERGIPAVDIIDFDYPYWHTSQDTLDKVSAASLLQVGETVLTWLERSCR